MHLIVGILSIFLTVICGVGGLLYGIYYTNLHELQRYAAYWFWIFPAMVTIQCFREHMRKRYVAKPKPKLSDEADALNNLAKRTG